MRLHVTPATELNPSWIPGTPAGCTALVHHRPGVCHARRMARLGSPDLARSARSGRAATLQGSQVERDWGTGGAQGGHS